MVSAIVTWILRKDSGHVAITHGLGVCRVGLLLVASIPEEDLKTRKDAGLGRLWGECRRSFSSDLHSGTVAKIKDEQLAILILIGTN